MQSFSPRSIDSATAPYAVLLLRVTLGAVFIAHALFKVLVLSVAETAAFFVEHGFPAWTAVPVFSVELVGGIALLTGIYPRLAAMSLLPVVAGAFTVHWPHGWYFAAPHGGWEYIAVLFAALVVQAGLGDGPFTVTAAAAHRNARRRAGQE